MNFSEDLKFKVWGFSTSRIVLAVDVINLLFCFGCLTAQDHFLDYPIGNECAPVASMLVLTALFFCLLPPFDNFKLLLCWPLTAVTMIAMLFLVSL